MTLRKRERLLTAIVMIGLVVLIGDRFVVTPMIQNWSDYGLEVVELEGKRTHYARLLESKATFESYATRIKRNELPTDGGKAENLVVNKLSQWATDSGLRLESVRPTLTEPRKKTSNSTLRIRLTGKGSLKSICKFVHTIETTEIPVTTKRIGLKSNDTSGKSLDVTLEIEAIMPPREVTK